MPMSRRRLFPLLALLLSCMALPSCFMSPFSLAAKEKKPAADRFRVVRVVDGDTIVVERNGKQEKVRYIGVDTPETKHPDKPVQYCGREASALNAKLVRDKDVLLELDAQERDKYGRILAYVSVAGGDGRDVLVNAALLSAGLATVLTIPPNVKHADAFLVLQKQARDKGAGLWGQGQCAAVEDKAASPGAAPGDCAYVASRNSGKFHKPGCQWAKKISAANRVCFASREQAVKQGHAPCKACKP